MPLRIMRAAGFALATALIFAVAVDPDAATQTLPSPLPAGPLLFRAFTAQFRVDGTFLVEGSVEGLGTLNVTGKWRAVRDIVELVGYDDPTRSGAAQANIFETIGIPTRGCETPGRYRYQVDGAQVSFDLIADDCIPRPHRDQSVGRVADGDASPITRRDVRARVAKCLRDRQETINRRSG